MNNNFNGPLSQKTKDFLKNKGINPDEVNKKDAKDLLNSLNNEDKEKINNLLKDKKALENFLNSDKAKQIMKNLFGKSNEWFTR